MATKANRTRAAQAAKDAEEKIEQAKKVYGLAKDNGSMIVKLVSTWAESPWMLAASLAAMVACVVVLLV